MGVSSPRGTIIQTSYHIRYGKTCGVAYRHVGTNYIAYFTHFILAGAYPNASTAGCRPREPLVGDCFNVRSRQGKPGRGKAA